MGKIMKEQQLMTAFENRVVSTDGSRTRAQTHAGTQ